MAKTYALNLVNVGLGCYNVHAQRQSAPFLYISTCYCGKQFTYFVSVLFMECKLLIIQGYLQMHDLHACMHALNFIESA